MSKRNGSDIPLQAKEIPPEAPCCANCGHSVVAQLPPPHIMRVRVCKLLPPTPVVQQRDRNGGILKIVSASPQVSDADFCAHFEKGENKVAGSGQGANEDSIAPTD